MSIQQQTVDLPSAWRGAAYNYGSSVDRQQAAPGNYPGCSTLADVRDRVMKRRFVKRWAMRTRWAIPGSRLLATLQIRTALKYPDESFGRTVQ